MLCTHFLVDCKDKLTLESSAGTNTSSDEYDSYREYRVANTNMYSRIHFFSEAKLGNGLKLVYACTMYSAQKFYLVYIRFTVSLQVRECASDSLYSLAHSINGMLE